MHGLIYPLGGHGTKDVLWSFISKKEGAIYLETLSHFPCLLEFLHHLILI